MFKNANEYAKQMMDLYFNDKSNACKELFNAAKIYPEVPTSFWYDVFIAIHHINVEEK